MSTNSADTLDFNLLPNFSESEFDHIDLSRMNENLFIELQNYRDMLGKRIYPSPLQDAWHRESGSTTSRHYAIDRLSDAGDVFPDCHILEAFVTALRCKFGGIGVYLDTHYQGKPWPMLHLDMRPVDQQAIWLREKVLNEEGKPEVIYTTFYPHRSPELLCDILKKLTEVSV